MPSWRDAGESHWLIGLRLLILPHYAVVSSPPSKECMPACNSAICTGKKQRSQANTWCASHGHPPDLTQMRSEKKQRSWARLAVIPTWSLLHCGLNPSTHAHARPPNGSILSRNHSNQWGHSNVWDDCMLRWRSHPIPCSWLNALQDHVLARLLNTMLHLLNLNHNALGLGLGLLLVMLTGPNVPFMLQMCAWHSNVCGRFRIWIWIWITEDGQKELGKWVNLLRWEAWEW